MAEDAAGSYVMDLDRTRQQLLVFAREVGEAYRRERRQKARLDKLVEERRSVDYSMVQTLAFMVDAKDAYTGSHLERCRTYGLALAEAVDSDMVNPELEYGFLLHDVGKVVVPEAILDKPGPLTRAEQDVMRSHVSVGLKIVSPLRFLDDDALDVIRCHHEWFNGAGYPGGLAGSAIPLSARVFSVVDAYDAMTTDRPYREAMPPEEALERLSSAAGRQFDPDVVDVFTTLAHLLPTPEVQIA
jgi:HD-GYP domain-containing protein (c-di-GMP phosphodiesterase class II)